MAADQVPQFQLNSDSAHDKQVLEIESQVVTGKDFVKLEMERKAEMA